MSSFSEILKKIMRYSVHGKCYKVTARMSVNEYDDVITNYCLKIKFRRKDEDTIDIFDFYLLETDDSKYDTYEYFYNGEHDSIYVNINETKIGQVVLPRKYESDPYFDPHLIDIIQDIKVHDKYRSGCNIEASCFFRNFMQDATFNKFDYFFNIRSDSEANYMNIEDVIRKMISEVYLLDKNIPTELVYEILKNLDCYMKIYPIMPIFE